MLVLIALISKRLILHSSFWKQLNYAGFSSAKSFTVDLQKFKTVIDLFLLFWTSFVCRTISMFFIYCFNPIWKGEGCNKHHRHIHSFCYRKFCSCYILKTYLMILTQKSQHLKSTNVGLKPARRKDWGRSLPLLVLNINLV